MLALLSARPRPHSLLGTLAWVVLFAGTTAPAVAVAPPSWPPADGPGQLFVHYGEDHLTDPDGARLLPATVADAIRYRPAAVFSSADKTDNGTEANFTAYKKVIAAYDRAGVPFFGAVGNHDRTAPPGLPGGLPGTLASDVYRAAFADRPYPWGDGTPVMTAGFAPTARPPGDPAGASTHYAVDVGPTRWLMIDNSCYAITACDPFQNPPFPDAQGSSGQFAWLARETADAKAKGKRVFIVMHMPTQDDRPGHSAPTPFPHTMGEGTSPDNQQLESAAAMLGIAGVFAGHIKAQAQYRAGGVPYFMDGGAGGELYVGSGEQVGVDSGYWYGYRLVRVIGESLSTDVVPLVAEDGVSVKGPDRLIRGQSAQFTATVRQPAEKGVKVPALALRDADVRRSNATRLPSPARIWTSDDPLVLAPVATPSDDPRRDPATQTRDGDFVARCPGRTQMTVTTGWASRSVGVTVASMPGPLARSIRRRARVVATSGSTRLAAVRLAQPARVLADVRRGGMTIATLSRRCSASRKPLAITWNGRLADGARARSGVYQLVVRVAGDRGSSLRRWSLRVR